MIHDPMCPTVNANQPFGLFHDDVTDDCLFCPLIAAVRQDERGVALDAARNAVEGTRPPDHDYPDSDRKCDCPYCCDVDRALAAIDALAATPATGGLIAEASYRPGQYGCVIDGGQ